MQKINLKRTHRLYYRFAWVKAMFALVLSLGVILLPSILIKDSSLPDNLLSATAWGVLWLVSSLIIIYGLLSKYFLFVKIGLVTLFSIYSMFCIGALFTRLIGGYDFSFFVVFVFLIKAILIALFLNEPPINPSTAVKSGADE